ncbi:uncharacterized protein RCO7_00692 [Rhynchosporium graminicola]|uniref:Uncharacterized protein n=1 Tax=Rhynchosporium graminicola TaxID=2792576 RepID=A0A1E1K1W9_9HELO|nr:uncharacterized protein RCO7_00692 [Rhynchosporium commune]
MPISMLETAQFATSRRLLAQLVIERLVHGSVIMTGLETWLHISSNLPPTRAEAEIKREVKVLLSSDAALYLKARNWHNQVIRPEHLRRPIYLQMTIEGEQKSREQLDPGTILEFVYPWFQHIDVLGRKEMIMKEVRNSAANQEEWLEIAKQANTPTLDSSAVEWERTMIWGHPTHPMHRSIGAEPPLDTIDSCNIPDMLEPDIIFMSVPRCDLIITGDFEELLQPLLCTLGITVFDKEHIIVPTLTRQQPAIQKYFPRARAVRTLHGSLALSNYRTVILRPEYKYQLKMALNCTITSAVRAITPGAARTAPQITKMLIEVLPKQLWFYEDVSSVVGSQISSDEAKQIGCILRLDLESRARANDEALVVSAVLLQGTVHSEITYAEKIFGLDTVEKKKVWFREYTALLLQVMIPPVVDHGIGFEPHDQNVVARICTKTRALKGFAIRDLGGIRLHLPTLQSQGYQLNSLTETENWLATSNIEDVWKKVRYSLFQNHLGQMICRLDLENEGGQNIVRQELVSILRPETGGVSKELFDFFMAEKVSCKPFLRMKMADNYRESQEEQSGSYVRASTIHDRVQMGQGTTFLPGPKDASIAHLTDQVLEQGYVILPNIFTPEQVSLANSELARLSAIAAGPASKGGRNAFEGFSTARIYSLCDKSRAFDCFPIHETVLKLNDYFLQKAYLMTSYHTVVIGPGEKYQEIHTDDGLINLPRPRPLMGIGTMISLDDFTSTNGATTLIPGSHLWPDSRQPTRAEMIPAIMPAGSMVYFLNTLWHSGGANTSSASRRSMTIQYCQPWIRTYENFTVAQGWEDLDVLPKRLLQLMGFSTHDFMGYVDGRSPRAGVEMRRKRLLEWGAGLKEDGQGEVGEEAQKEEMRSKL